MHGTQVKLSALRPLRRGWAGLAITGAEPLACRGTACCTEQRRGIWNGLKTLAAIGNMAAIVLGVPAVADRPMQNSFLRILLGARSQTGLAASTGGQFVHIASGNGLKP